MVVRDGDHPSDPLEVLMVRRSLRADFAGGAYVYPGGTLDPADAGPLAEELCSGRDDVSASALLGVASGGLAFWVAAVRECFEEAGLLLAGGPGGGVVSLAEPVVSARFAHHRRELNAGRAGFLEICRAEGLALAVDGLFYFAHWITPEGAPRRYDTRFFVAAAPVDQTPAHDAGETIEDVWVRPADALEQYRRGAIEMVLPTVRTLGELARFPTSRDLLEAASRPRAVPAILPRITLGVSGARLLVPGDEGYDDAATPLAGGG